MRPARICTIKVFASGDEVIDLEVLLPPAAEIFDLPAEFINQGEVFGGHPICRPTDSVTC